MEEEEIWGKSRCGMELEGVEGGETVVRTQCMREKNKSENFSKCMELKTMILVR